MAIDSAGRESEAPASDIPPTGEDSTRAVRRRWVPANLAGSLLANAFLFLLLGLWWWQSRAGVAVRWPPPLEVLGQIDDFLWGDLAYHTIATLRRVVIAVIVAMVIGAVLVMLARTQPLFQPLVNRRILPLFNAMPALGWAILGVIWLGVSDLSVLAVEIAILIPFTMINLAEGLNVLDPGLLEMGQSFTRRRSRILRLIEIPLLVPYLFASLRLSFGVGFKVAVIAEFFGAREGLGLVMNQARQSFNTTLVYATIITVVMVVFVVERLLFEPIGRLVARRLGTSAEAASDPQSAAAVAGV